MYSMDFKVLLLISVIFLLDIPDCSCQKMQLVDSQDHLQDPETDHAPKMIPESNRLLQNSSMPMRTVEINQCFGDDANLGTQMEFSTNTTRFRLKKMVKLLECGNGRKPRQYFSKGHHQNKNTAVGDGNEADDDYEYYDDSAESAGLSQGQGQGSLFDQNVNRAPEAVKNIEDLYIIPNGKLQIQNSYFNVENYCVSSYTGANIEVLVCEPSCSPPTELWPCLKKCCEFGYTFSPDTAQCVKSVGNLDWTPTFFDDNNLDISAQVYPQLRIQMPTGCNHGLDIWPFEFGDNHQLKVLQEYTKVQLLPDGSAKYLTRNRNWQLLDLKSEEFCIESGELIPGIPQNQMIIKCSRTSYADEIGILIKLLVILYTIASVILFLATIVYILLWIKQKWNSHNWPIFAEIFSILIYYVSLTIIYFLIINVRSVVPFLGTNACVVIAVTSHFAYISIFSWMVVINFDFWSTFRLINEPPTLTRLASGGKLRCLFYTLVGVGIPTLVVSFGLLMDHVYSDPGSGVSVPAYGQYFTCSISRWAEGPYTYFIIGILYIASLLFLVKTFYIINALKAATTQRIWNKNYGNGATAAKDKGVGILFQDKYWWFKIFFKICIVSGLTWIVEIISFVVFNFKSNYGDSTTSDVDSTLMYAFISDLILGLQPIGIFLVFLCKKRVRVDLREKYVLFEKFGHQIDKLVEMSANSSEKMLKTSNSKRATHLGSPKLPESYQDQDADAEVHEEMIAMVRKDSLRSVDTVDGHFDASSSEADSTEWTSTSWRTQGGIDRETNV